MTPSKSCVDLVKEFEGCKLTSYPDPASGLAPWTIGFGSTGPDVHPNLTWTQQQCDDRLIADVARVGRSVDKITGPTTQNRFDALVSFAYNLGVGNLMGSTLLRMHKAGDYAGAADQFQRWDKGAGKVMDGLLRRRLAEAQMYRGAS